MCQSPLTVRNRALSLFSLAVTMALPFAHPSAKLALLRTDLRTMFSDWAVTVLIALYGVGFEHRT
jgi:hypothetical protein